MPAQLTTRQQVNGYRFLLRRLDHALVRRDVRMLHDPMRSQLRSLLVGAEAPPATVAEARGKTGGVVAVAQRNPVRAARLRVAGAAG
ncbi:type VII secretion protein EccB, partial [Nocardia cyriacigeorgica]|uniref:type VII secretion protein EccB n=1 Tax=Nocardia cyriacigeorgica TaxID=135487 RepID=UPI0024562F29